MCIKLASGINLIAYNSPNKAYNTKDIDNLLKLGNRVLLLEDLNARHQAWNCHINNKRGKLSYKYVLKNNCTIIFLDEPIHYPENGATVTNIDIGINKNITGLSELKVLNEMSSDHNPIFITLESQIKNNNNKLVYDYDAANWDKFKQILHKKVIISSNIKTSKDLESEVYKLTNLIQNCIKQTTLTKTAQQLQDRFPSKILLLIKRRNGIRTKWQITKNPTYKKIVKKETKAIRVAITKHRNDMWTKKLEKLILKTTHFGE